MRCRALGGFSHVAAGRRERAKLPIGIVLAHRRFSAVSRRPGSGCTKGASGRHRGLTAYAAATQTQSENTLATQDPEVIEAKSAILLEILTAGRQVEQRIQEYASEVDPVMLRLLERRIAAAKKCDEEPQHIEGLHMLHRRLRLIVERRNAKATELLLDDLLSRMGQPDWMNTDEQRQEVMDVMRMAFGLPDVEVNILGVASEMSPDYGEDEDDASVSASTPTDSRQQAHISADGDDGKEVDEEDDELPIVSIPEFAQDTRDLLKGALKDCVELRKALESRKYQDKASILEQTLNERVLLARQLEDLIRMSDHVTMGLSALDPQIEIDSDSDE